MALSCLAIITISSTYYAQIYNDLLILLPAFIVSITVSRISVL